MAHAAIAVSYPRKRVHARADAGRSRRAEIRDLRRTLSRLYSASRLLRRRAIVREWKGLGYNARAVRLQRLAVAVVERHAGVLPSESKQLRLLPGVGPYTAAAIRAFAFNLDDAPIDTNVKPDRAAREVRRRISAFGDGTGARCARPRARTARTGARLELGFDGSRSNALHRTRPEMPALSAAREVRSSAHRRRKTRASCGRPPSRADPHRARCRTSAPRAMRGGASSIVFANCRPGRRISLLDLHHDVAPAISGRSFEEVRDFVAGLERDGIVMRDGNHVALRE